MKNLFNSVKMSRPKRNVFDLSHDVKLSLDMGFLVPTCCIDAVPGDHFSLGCESLLRFAPLVAPVMHRMDVYMHYFFVPRRLLWPNWENYITNTEVAGSLPAFPYLEFQSGMVSVLADYFGIPEPILGGPTERVSAMPFSAYALIYNEYYRDQNLIAEVPYELVDGDNTVVNADLYDIRRRAWEHDYFTAALPFAQKGAAVTLPLGTFGDVPIIEQDSSAVGVGDTFGNVQTTNTPSGSPDGAFWDLVNRPGLTEEKVYADTSSLQAGASTINDLRRAFRLQEWLEKAARGGSRYAENILSFFGVRSPDARLQRPEYITGTKSPVIISEVLNTTGTATAAQGEMAGHAVSVTTGKYGKYFCQEHGYIMGIMSVLPKTAYQQGIPKHFLKINDPFEHYWPQFAHIGEQEVLERELFAYTATSGATFGYVPRYAEYKFEPNRVAGDFKTTLDFWHLGRKFASPPLLNQQFVEADPTDRVFAVTGPPNHLYAQVLHRIRAVRPMPKFGTPTF